MRENWHFYCDEAGEFETIKNFSNYKNSILAGFLIPDSKRELLSEEYSKLLNKHGFKEGFIHGKDLYKNPAYKNFTKDLVALTVNSPVKLCRTTFKQDIFYTSGENISETFACNRYLYMMESLLEHIIFLDSQNFEIDQSFFLHPNSRVFPCNQAKSEKFKSNGFHVFAPDKTKPDNYLVKVWDETGLRVFINRLCTDYSPFVSMLGERTIDEIEMPVAKKSQDNFVHWIDNLAGILMWKNDKIKNDLEDFLYMDIKYGETTDLHKKLCMLYLQKEFDEFINLYFQSINTIHNDYYKNRLNTLVEKSLGKFNTSSIQRVYQLERIVDNHLHSGTGELEYVTAVVDYLIKALSNFETTEKKLLLKLYNHKLSYHNHRGEVMEAWNIVKKARELDCPPNTIEEWRDEIEFINRQAVASANVFDFTSCNPQLEQILKTLTNAKESLNQSNNLELRDPLIGKVSGTLAQNYAFSAPFQTTYFKKAEKIFLSARSEFENPSDILRQNIYLAHLYMNKEDNSKIYDIVNTITSDASVKKFIDNPCSDNAKYMGFPLAVLLKFYLYDGKNNGKFLDTFTKKNIRAWFQNAANEHPFEFIYAYLGRLSFQYGSIKQGESFFNSALTIPIQGKTSQQITIRMIQTEILVWWALEYFNQDNNIVAVDKLNKAVNILDRTGEDELFAPILKIVDKKGVSGWFANGYNTLAKAIDEKTDYIDACNEFLKYFTFNYR